MTESDEGRLMLDLTHFASRDDAINKIQLDREFEDSVRGSLGQAIDSQGRFDVPIAFCLSSITRARGLHEAIVREIEQANPVAVFVLMRQYAETLAIIYYVADHPNYVYAVARKARDIPPNEQKRKNIQSILHYMDTNYSDQFGLVYASLSELAHFGSTAVWGAHRITSKEEGTTEWSSKPAWRDDRELYVACAQLLELKGQMKVALNKLARSNIKSA